MASNPRVSPAAYESPRNAPAIAGRPAASPSMNARFDHTKMPAFHTYSPLATKWRARSASGFSAKRAFMDGLDAGRPAIAGAFRGLSYAAGDTRAFEAMLAERFPGVESISVDYALLVKAPNVVAIDASFDWDDLGSWGAWARRQPQDERGNVTWGQAVPVDCDRCVIVGDGFPAAPLGLSDMVVVATPQGTLVCRRQDTDQVRRVTEAVRARGSQG